MSIEEQAQNTESYQGDDKEPKYLEPFCTQEDLPSTAEVLILLLPLKKIDLQEPSTNAM